VVGDADGLLSIPYDSVEEVLAATRNKKAAEVKTLENIAAGRHDTAWVDEFLKRIGCDPQPR
jgi:regulator of RNase E activity RraA